MPDYGDVTSRCCDDGSHIAEYRLKTRGDGREGNAPRDNPMWCDGKNLLLTDNWGERTVTVVNNSHLVIVQVMLPKRPRHDILPFAPRSTDIEYQGNGKECSETAAPRFNFLSYDVEGEGDESYCQGGDPEGGESDVEGVRSRTRTKRTQDRQSCHWGRA